MKYLKESEIKEIIAIDFDGVIHKYSKGWYDGTIYDKPVKETFEAIEQLMKRGYSIFIFSARNSRQIKKWLDKYLFIEKFKDHIYSKKSKDYIYNYNCKIIPFWTESWTKKWCLGITKRKLPAILYIDDRAIKFTNWKNVLKNKKLL